MKRRLLILTLTIIFSLSTTALPLVLHYCTMMEATSFAACEMHSKNNESSCCMEDEDFELYYTKQIDECCMDYIVDESVKDDFVSSKVELSGETQFSVVILSNDALTKFLEHELFINISPSPPLLYSSHIYLFNSVLLI